MNWRRAAGFTLIELILAIALAGVLMTGLSSFFTPIIRAQTKTAKTLQSQGDALLALKSAGLDISQASEIYYPPEASNADGLSGCINYDSTAGAPISAGMSSRSFYYCLNGGNLYYFSAPASPSSCKAIPVVCSPDGILLARNVVCTTGCFNRPAGSRNVVELRYQVVNKDSLQDIRTAVVYQGALQ